MLGLGVTCSRPAGNAQGHSLVCRGNTIPRRVNANGLVTLPVQIPAQRRDCLRCISLQPVQPRYGHRRCNLLLADRCPTCASGRHQSTAGEPQSPALGTVFRQRLKAGDRDRHGGSRIAWKSRERVTGRREPALQRDRSRGLLLTTDCHSSALEKAFIYQGNPLRRL